MNVIGVRKADRRKIPPPVRKRKLQKTTFALYHTPKPLFKTKSRKQKLSRWKKRKINDSGVTYWAKNDHWPFNKPIKKTWAKNITKNELKRLRQSYFSAEETKLLFDLCDQYDAKFIVVTDRYNLEKKPEWKERTKAELKKRYFATQERLILSRNRKLFCNKNNFRLDMQKEQHRMRELEKLLVRTQEQTEHMSCLTLQRRKIAKALKQHRKDVASRRRNLKEQHTLIKKRLQDSRRALTIGNQHGFNVDFGVVIQDKRMASAKNRDRGVFAQIPDRILPQFSERKTSEVTSTTREWNARREVTINGFGGRKAVDIRVPFQEEDMMSVTLGSAEHRMTVRLQKFFQDNGIDTIVSSKSDMIATSVVHDMYEQMRKDLLIWLSWEHVIPHYKSRVKDMRREISALKDTNERLEKQAQVETKMSKMNQPMKPVN